MERCVFLEGFFVGAIVIVALVALWVMCLPKIQRDALFRWRKQGRQPPPAWAPEVIDISLWDGEDYARRKRMRPLFPDGCNQ